MTPTPSSPAPSARAVADASAAWVWTPDGSEVIEADGYTLMKLPDHVEWDLSVLEFTPTGPLGTAVDTVLARARTFGLRELDWEVKLGAPAGLAAELSARGADTKVTLEVMARDLSRGAPALPPPTVDVACRWATDPATLRDGTVLGVAAFHGSVPSEEQLGEKAAQDAKAVPAGGGGMVVGYVDGEPAGSGGVQMADGVARLWGGAVDSAWRGRGVYRSLLDARMSYAAAHGATMALVKANVVTSGPILRRAGFTGYGRETIHRFLF